MISSQVVKRDIVSTDSSLKVNDSYYSSAALNSIATLMFWNQTNVTVCSLNLITLNKGEPVITNTGSFINLETP
jgi:hypothetical protein